MDSRTRPRIKLGFLPTPCSPPEVAGRSVEPLFAPEAAVELSCGGLEWLQAHGSFQCSLLSVLQLFLCSRFVESWVTEAAGCQHRLVMNSKCGCQVSG